MALALVFKPGAGQGDLLNSDEVKKYGAERKLNLGMLKHQKIKHSIKRSLIYSLKINAVYG